MNQETQATNNPKAEDHPEIRIQQQTNYAQQRLSSSNALAKISAVAADQKRASAVGQATISSLPKDEQFVEGARKKSANMVVTNVIRISGSELKTEEVERQDESKDTSDKNESVEQKRVIVKEILKDEPILTNEAWTKNKQKIQYLMGKTLPDLLDNDCMTPISRLTAGNKISLSNTNVKSLTIDHHRIITLSNLEAIAFAAVLQECLEFLSILQYVIPAEIDEQWDESFKTIDQLYGVPDERKMIFREDTGLPPLIPSKAVKLQRDRTYVYEVLNKTMSKIKNENTFEFLETTIDNLAKTQENERELQINCELWMEQVKQLQELIEYDKLEFEKKRKEQIDIAQNMNAEVDNSIFLNGSELGYVERWEEAQVEKQQLTLDQKEVELLTAKANCEKMEKADQIVSGEVRTYLEASTREMEDEIVSWTSQYIEELERRQQEMSEFADHIGEQVAELNELTLLRDERQAFIDEVLAEKERIKMEEEYWREVHRAATLIQTYWRGYMVRKQIGPFKGLWAQLKKRKGRAGSAKKKKKKTKSGKKKNLKTSTAKKKK